MSLKLVDGGRVPYGGEYVLNLPEKGMVGRGYIFEVLCDRIRKYRRANAIPVGLNFEEEVEREICAKYPKECVETDDKIPKRRRLTWRDVVNGTMVMLNHKLHGSPIVDQDEANRRAAICSRCPYNTEFAMKCGGVCSELKDIVAKVIGSKTTPFDEKLKSCSVCGCFLSVSVWADLNVQCVGVTEDQKAQFRYVLEQARVPCWKQCQ